jgi:Glycosyl transferase family 2
MAQQPLIRRVSFVLPVKNDAVRLKTCLEAIAGCPHPGTTVETVVADNGSTDGSPDVAVEAGVRVLRLPGLGVSELRNRAAAAATGELLAFVDADHIIAPGWTAGALDLMSDDRVGAGGAIYLAPAAGTWVQQAYGALRGRTIGRKDTAWLGSGNLVVRRTAFEAVAGFDTSLAACEDVDLCQRLRATGWRVVADERLASVHLGDPATLGAVFRAERWRGRDNLKVSFRGPMTLRDLPSALIPLIDLAAFALAAWGLATWPVAGRTALETALVACATVLGLATIRVVRGVLAGHVPLGLAPRAYAVALTWDIARALAIVWPAPHHRSPGKAPSGVALT